MYMNTYTHMYIINIYKNKIRPRERKAYTAGTKCVYTHIYVLLNICV